MNSFGISAHLPINICKIKKQIKAKLIIHAVILKRYTWFFSVVLLVSSSIWGFHPLMAETMSQAEFLKYKKKYIKTKSNIDLFNYANALYMRGQYNLAYKGYRLVVTRNSKLETFARYYMSLALIKMDKSKQALDLLTKLAQDDLKPNLRKNVTAKIKALSKQKKSETKVYVKRKRFNLLTDLSFGYNTNPELNSDDENSFDDEDAGDMEYKGMLNASYWLYDSLKFDSKLAATMTYLSYTEKQDLTNMLLSTNIATAGYIGLYRFRITPAYTQEYNDGELILSNVSSNFDIARKLPKGLISLGVNFGMNSPMADEFNYLEGERFFVYSDFSYKFKKTALYLYAEYFDNSYIDEVQNESNNGYQLSAKFKYYFNKSFSVETGYRYKVRKYNESNLFFDDGTRTFSLNLAREDELSQLDLAINYNLYKGMDMSLILSQIENKSTFDSIFTDVGDKNYELLNVKLNFGFYF